MSSNKNKNNSKSKNTKKERKTKIKVGMHIRSDVDVMEETIEALDSNANTIQLFIDGSYERDRYKEIGKLLVSKNLNGYVHSSLKINAAKPWTKESWWVSYFIYEMKIAKLLGLSGIVLHTGSSNGTNERAALNNLYTFMTYVDKATQKESSVKIILETSAGQGSALLSDYNEFLCFMTKFKHNKRFGICIDTCHVFAAGMDIREKKIFNKMLSKCEKKLGLDRLMLIHLNDSKHDLGERKDRHESLGYGFIGRNGLKHIIKKLKVLNVPIILETPFLFHENELEWITK